MLTRSCHISVDEEVHEALPDGKAGMVVFTLSIQSQTGNSASKPFSIIFENIPLMGSNASFSNTPAQTVLDIRSGVSVGVAVKPSNGSIEHIYCRNFTVMQAGYHLSLVEDDAAGLVWIARPVHPIQSLVTITNETKHAVSICFGIPYVSPSHDATNLIQPISVVKEFKPGKAIHVDPSQLVMRAYSTITQNAKSARLRTSDCRRIQANTGNDWEVVVNDLEDVSSFHLYLGEDLESIRIEPWLLADLTSHATAFQVRLSSALTHLTRRIQYLTAEMGLVRDDSHLLEPIMSAVSALLAAKDVILSNMIDTSSAVPLFHQLADKMDHALDAATNSFEAFQKAHGEHRNLSVRLENMAASVQEITTHITYQRAMLEVSLLSDSRPSSSGESSVARTSSITSQGTRQRSEYEAQSMEQAARQTRKLQDALASDITQSHDYIRSLSTQQQSMSSTLTFLLSELQDQVSVAPEDIQGQDTHAKELYELLLQFQEAQQEISEGCIAPRQTVVENSSDIHGLKHCIRTVQDQENSVHKV